MDSASSTSWSALPSGSAYGRPATPSVTRRSAVTAFESTAPTAAERVIAAELLGRGGACDALSMMVSSMARMVQAGRCSENRWTLG